MMWCNCECRALKIGGVIDPFPSVPLFYANVHSSLLHTILSRTHILMYSVDRPSLSLSSNAAATGFGSGERASLLTQHRPSVLEESPLLLLLRGCSPVDRWKSNKLVERGQDDRPRGVRERCVCAWMKYVLLCFVTRGSKLLFLQEIRAKKSGGFEQRERERIGTWENWRPPREVLQKRKRGDGKQFKTGVGKKETTDFKNVMDMGQQLVALASVDRYKTRRKSAFVLFPPQSPPSARPHCREWGQREGPLIEGETETPFLCCVCGRPLLLDRIAVWRRRRHRLIRLVKKGEGKKEEERRGEFSDSARDFLTIGISGGIHMCNMGQAGFKVAYWQVLLWLVLYWYSVRLSLSHTRGLDTCTHLKWGKWWAWVYKSNELLFFSPLSSSFLYRTLVVTWAKGKHANNRRRLLQKKKKSHQV